MQRLGDFFARIAQRSLPEPLVLACLLTLVVFAVALACPLENTLRSAPPISRALMLATMWLDAVWNPRFLTFALQMCVVLLTGFGLARAPVVLGGLRRLAGLVHSNRGAVGLIAAVSCVGCWINWGFGLVLAGVLALEVRAALQRRGAACQFAVIVAAAYAGMMIWHGGFSGSAPLKAASDGVVLRAASADAPAERIAPIPVPATILHPVNLALTAVLIVGIPLVLRAMAQRVGGDVAEGAVASPADVPGSGSSREAATLADRINHAWWLPRLIAALLLVGLGRSLALQGGGAIGLNFVNSTFLALGLLLHRDLGSYMGAVMHGGRAIVGIVVQFPLYSGIQGVMFGAGLAAGISQGFVDAAEWTAGALGVSAASTFPLGAYLSAAVVNFFVPSGGGQWIVQGPIMCSAAEALNVPYGQTVMAIAYGDQLTNMVQPFWAIPLMGMTQVDARQFMGYCALLMLLAAPVFAAALLLF